MVEPKIKDFSHSLYYQEYNYYMKGSKQLLYMPSFPVGFQLYTVYMYVSMMTHVIIIIVSWSVI